MKFENPPPQEGINYTQEHPLKEFAQLLIGVTLAIVLLVLMLNFFAGTMARYIPFEFEQKMIANLDFAEPEESPQQAYLQSLADRISAEMDLPEGMNIAAHYDNSDVVNAYATLGGNLFFFKGLIDKLETEEELAAVMAHEIAHIKYRHPIVALGKGLTLASLAAFISGTSASRAGDWLIGSSVNLTLLKFSRDQERESDAAAAAALSGVYGHIGGAEKLFRHFADLEGNSESENPAVVEMFRSHPYSQDRWLDLKTMAQDNGWATSGEYSKLAFPD